MAKKVLVRKVHEGGSGMQVVEVDEGSLPRYRKMGWSPVWPDLPKPAPEPEQPVPVEAVEPDRSMRKAR